MASGKAMAEKGRPDLGKEVEEKLHEFITYLKQKKCVYLPNKARLKEILHVVSGGSTCVVAVQPS